MTTFRMRIQLALAVVVFGGAWTLSSSEAVAAFDGCTPAQWQECICAAPGDCETANGPAQPGYCWLGSPDTCDNGVCTGSCQEWPEEWCEETIPGC